MNLSDVAIHCVMVFISTYVLVYVIKQAFQKRQLLDVPNARSAHQLPTPHGGGLAIVVVVCAYVFGVGLEHVVLNQHWRVLLVCALPIAISGLLDDVLDVSAKKRLLLQCVCAVIAAAYLLTNVTQASGVWLLCGVVVLMVALVWVLNLYNFMDGIDGIAGVQGATMCLSVIVIAHVSELTTHLLPFFYVLLPAMLGFLVWNAPRARIFMGDVGSGFLGFVFALSMVLMSSEHALWLPVWLIVFAVFFVDASVTLLRRFVRGHTVTQAHCNHAYQYAARVHQSHAIVSSAVVLINVCVLLPIALSVALHIISPWFGIACAYIPLIGLALHYRAGAEEQQRI
ncbi:MAG: glycosyltransferase family 4 protein [Pseudomonadota bacterium]